MMLSVIMILMDFNIHKESTYAWTPPLPSSGIDHHNCRGNSQAGGNTQWPVIEELGLHMLNVGATTRNNPSGARWSTYQSSGNTDDDLRYSGDHNWDDGISRPNNGTRDDELIVDQGLSLFSTRYAMHWLTIPLSPALTQAISEGHVTMTFTSDVGIDKGGSKSSTVFLAWGSGTQGIDNFTTTVGATSGVIPGLGDNWWVEASASLSGARSGITSVRVGLYQNKWGSAHMDLFGKNMRLEITSTNSYRFDAVPEQVYDGNAKTPAFTVRDNATNAVLTQGTHFNLIGYENNVNATTNAKIKLAMTGVGGYVGNPEIIFTIAPRSITFDIDEITTTFTYDKVAKTPTVTVRDTELGRVLTQGVDYTVVYINNINAGVAQARVFGANNYAGSSGTQYFDIDQRPITLQANSYTKTYGESDPVLGYQITAGSIVSGDALQGSLTRTGTNDVGEYEIEQGTLFNSNYDINFINGTFNILHRNIEVTIDNKSKIYGDDDPAFTYQITSGNLVFSDTIFALFTREDNNNVGSYSITESIVTAGPNYNITVVDGTLSITPRDLEIFADAKFKTFKDSDPVFTFDAEGLQYDDDMSIFTGGLNRAIGEDVGSYQINRNNLSAGDNYTIIYHSANLTINPLATTVVVEEINDIIFTGFGLEPGTVVTEGVDALVFGDDYTVSYANNLNVGVATVTITGIGNYLGSTGSQTFTIIPREILLDILAIADQNWTGNEIEPLLSVSSDLDLALILNVDYTVVFTNNIEMGIASLEITGIGNYLGSTGSAQFIIISRIITFNVDYLGEFTWTGNEIKPIPTVRDGDKILLIDVDYTITYYDYINVGLARIEIAGIGNYEFSDGLITYHITSFIVDIIANQTFTKVEIEPVVTVYSGFDTLTLDVDYTVEYFNNINVGIAYVEVTGIGIYTDNFRTQTFVIIPKVTVFAIDNIDDQTYTGDELEPVLTVYEEGTLLILGQDYQVIYNNNIDVTAEAEVYVTGIGNYAGTTLGYFTIVPKVMVFAVDEISVQIYTSLGLEPVILVRDNARVLIIDQDYYVTYTNNINVGIADVEVNGLGNYLGSEGTQTFIIDPKVFTFDINNIFPRVYTGWEIEPTAFVFDNVIQLVKNEHYTVSYSDNINAGTASVHISGIGNYFGSTGLQTFSITPKQITILANARSKFYGNNDPVLTFTALEMVNTPHADNSFTGSLVRVAGEAVGQYTINRGTLQSSPNYTITFVSNVFTINKRPITITPHSLSKTYGQNDPAFTYSITTGNLVFGDKLTGQLSRVQGEDVGNYQFLIGSVNNPSYTITLSDVDFVINQLTITLEADNKSKFYADNDPALTYSFVSNALLNGDILEGEISRVEGEDADTYAINQGSLYHHNYNIIFIDGIFTINPKEITVIFSDYELIYNGGEQTINASANDLEEGDEVFVVLTYDKEVKNVDTYIATADIQHVNYVLVGDLTFEFNISPKQITVSFSNYDLTYNGSVQEIVATANDVEDGDTVIVLMDYDDEVINVGQYSATASIDELNYELIGVVDIDFSISPKAITVTFSSYDNLVYNGQPQIIDATANDVEVGDDVNVFLSYDRIVINAGEYTATASIDNDNYVLDGDISQDFTVSPKEVHFIALSAEKIYSDVDPELLYDFDEEDIVEGNEFEGQLSREEGEDVGSYLITLGTLNNDNYLIILSEEYLVIIPREISVQAVDTSKTYGEDDPEFFYAIISGELIGDDELLGSMTREAGEDVGSYDISIGTLGNDNYVIVEFVKGEMTIVAREVTVTFSNYDLVYNRSIQTVTATLNNLAFSDEVDITINYSDEVLNVDSYTATASINELNYILVGTFELEFNVSPKPITVSFSDYELIYNGDEQEITIQLNDVIVGDIVLFETAYSDDVINASQYTVTVTIDELNYELSGDASFDFEVAPKAITVSFSNYSDLVYNGIEQEINVEAYGVINDEEINLSLSYNDTVINAGQYTATAVIDNDNYTFQGIFEQVFDIVPKAIIVTANPNSKIYGDDDPELTYEVEEFGLYGDDELYGALSREEGTVIGDYLIEIGTLNNDNYVITLVSDILTINPRPITLYADAVSKAYGDGDPILTFSDLDSQVAYGDAFGGELEREAGEEIGQYLVTVGTLNNDNYVITFASDYFSINPRPITLKAVPSSKIYGMAQDPALSYTIYQGNLVNGDELTGSVVREAGETAGNHLILQGSVDNVKYDITFVSAYFTITPLPITVRAVANTKVYGDNDPDIGYIITSGSLINGDVFSGNVSRDTGEDVGSYWINRGTLNNSNYNISFVRNTFAITQRNITITARELTKIYGDDDPAFEFDVTNGSIAFDDTFNGSMTRESGLSVGEYAILRGTFDNTNYNITFLPSTLTITPRPLDVYADEVMVFYGEEEALTYQAELQYADELNGSLVREEGDTVGSYLISQGTLNNDNYIITFVGANYTIIPRPITVTADAKTIIYGDNDVEMTYQTDDLINGDILNGNITREMGLTVGSYLITQGTLYNPNYSITFVEANYTINPRPLTVTADEVATIYGEDVELTYSADDLINGDVLYGSLVREGGLGVGEYLISIGNLNNNNYDITFVEANYTINLRPITVVADAISIIYGDDDVELTYQVELINDDVLYGSIIRAEGRDVNSYLITQGSLYNDNYDITFVEANYIINPRPVTVTADAKSIVYGEDDVDLTYDAELLNGDLLYGSLTREAGINVGVYLITQGTLNNPNYDIIFIEADYVITAKEITVTAQAASRVYGELDAELLYLTEGLINGDILSGQLEREAGNDVGDYQILQGSLDNANYTIEFVGALYSITARPVTVTADSITSIYGDEDSELTYQVELIGDDVLYGSLVRDAGITVGSYSIGIGTLDNSNYNITFVSAEYFIVPRTVTVVADAKSVIYGDDEVPLTYSVELVGDDELYGSLEREAGNNAGVYAILLGSLNNANYDITFVSADYVIVPRAVTLEADAKSVIYGDDEVPLTYSVELVGDDELSGSLAREAGDNVGNYAILLGTLYNANYDLTLVSVDYVIMPRAVTVYADAQTVVYGDQEAVLTYMANLIGDDVLHGSMTRAIGKNVGNYLITQGTLNNANYDITFVNAEYQIIPRPITISAQERTKVYGQSDPTLTYVITEGNLVVGDTLSGILSRAAGENVGSYLIGSTLANANYDITFISDNLTITRRPITVKADSKSKVYGQADSALTFLITSGNLVGVDTLNGLLQRDPGENAGSYIIHRGTLNNDNYVITFELGSLTIEPRAITVKANSYTVPFGSADPIFAYEVVQGSLLGNDRLGGVLVRDAGTSAGVYTIRRGTLANRNYAITFETGTLTIDRSISSNTGINVDEEEAIKTIIREDNVIVAYLDRGMTSFAPAITVAENSTYQIFADPEMTVEISDSTLNLRAGENTRYIKVVAEDGTETMYTLVINNPGVTTNEFGIIMSVIAAAAVLIFLFLFIFKKVLA